MRIKTRNTSKKAKIAITHGDVINIFNFIMYAGVFFMFSLVLPTIIAYFTSTAFIIAYIFQTLFWILAFLMYLKKDTIKKNIYLDFVDFKKSRDIQYVNENSKSRNFYNHHNYYKNTKHNRDFFRYEYKSLISFSLLILWPLYVLWIINIFTNGLSSTIKSILLGLLLTYILFRNFKSWKKHSDTKRKYYYHRLFWKNYIKIDDTIFFH